MEVKQIATIVNTITEEMMGESAILSENLENVVEVGTAIENLGSAAYENYVRSLVDHIGRVVFVNRPYSGSAPSVLRDSWEYGSILEKITAAMPEATENESWQLTDNTVYEQDRFTRPTVSAKFYDQRYTFEVPMSFAEEQSKSAFSSAQQLNAFFSMIETQIYNSLTVKNDGLVMRTINNAIATTIEDGNSARVVNLAALYNATVPAAEQVESVADAVRNPGFIRYAAYLMGLYKSRMSKISTLFNIGAQPRFTPEDRLHIVMLNDFAMAADVWNQSDTFHEEFTALPNAERVPYWQGSGTGYAIADTSAIKVTTAGGDAVDVNGVLGVMFDRDALGICNDRRTVTTHYNARAQFFNNWYKVFAGAWNDFNENIVVFGAFFDGE